MSLVNLLSRGAGVVVGSQISLRIAHRTQPRPFPTQLKTLLEHPARLAYRDPVGALGPFGLGPGMTVLDLGCGTGLFTVEMARQVGSTGRVEAVDIQKGMLTTAQAKLASAGLDGRVRFHHKGAYRLPLEENSVDVAVLIATLVEIPDPVFALEEVRRVLKPDGRIAVSEELPHPGYAPASVVRGWLRTAGFRYGGQLGSPFCYSLLYFAE